MPLLRLPGPLGRRDRTGDPWHADADIRKSRGPRLHGALGHLVSGYPRPAPRLAPHAAGPGPARSRLARHPAHHDPRRSGKDHPPGALGHPLPHRRLGHGRGNDPDRLGPGLCGSGDRLDHHHHDASGVRRDGIFRRQRAGDIRPRPRHRLSHRRRRPHQPQARCRGIEPTRRRGAGLHFRHSLGLVRARRRDAPGRSAGPRPGGLLHARGQRRGPGHNRRRPAQRHHRDPLRSLALLPRPGALARGHVERLDHGLLDDRQPAARRHHRRHPPERRAVLRHPDGARGRRRDLHLADLGRLSDCGWRPARPSGRPASGTPRPSRSTTDRKKDLS